MAHNPTGIESQLFDWTGWDEVDTFSLIFFNVVLKVPIGEFKIGQEFDSAVVDASKSTLKLFPNGAKYAYHEYELKVSIGNKIGERVEP